MASTEDAATPAASTENAVREAAAALYDAIVAAQDEGYRVEWPANAAGLQSIAVSETAKVSEKAKAGAAAVKPGDEPPAVA